MNILTDEEIMDINQNAEFDSAIGYARKIESVVLEKLKAQEPDKTKIECVTGAIYKHISGELYPREVIAAAEYIVHRYCSTPDDVVRDAARYKWLRENVGVFNDGYYRPWMPIGNSKIECADKLETDRAIDAAMKEMK